MRRNIIALLFLVIITEMFLQSCSSLSTSKVWVISRWQNGGVLGYRGDDNDIVNNISDYVHCKDYRIVKHVFKSRRVPKDYYYDYLRDYSNTPDEVYAQNTKEYRYYHRAPASESGDYLTYSGKHHRDYAYYDNYYNDRYWRELTYQCYYNPYNDYNSTRFYDYPRTYSRGSDTYDEDYYFYRP
jgi:hypothetical protein